MGKQTDLISTGAAGRILGSSRQHVVDLCERGVLASVSTGRHRRVRRSDVERLARSGPLNGRGDARRPERRSRWLHQAVAGRLVRDPEGVLARARANLRTMAAAHPSGMSAHWLSEWRALIGAGPLAVLDALTADTPLADELRQNSPFAGVLSEEERATVLAAFRWAEQAS